MSFYFPTQEECGHHTIFPGVRLESCASEKMMISVVDLDPHSVVAEHSHFHEQVGVIIQGKVHFFIGDEDRVLGPGAMYRIPGNVKHKVITLDAPARAIDIFCPPREEYR